jgi:hypothetical protein
MVRLDANPPPSVREDVPDGVQHLLPEEAGRQAKEQAQQRAEQLEVLLRSQGIDPNQLPQ